MPGAPWLLAMFFAMGSMAVSFERLRRVHLAVTFDLAALARALGRTGDIERLRQTRELMVEQQGETWESELVRAALDAKSPSERTALVNEQLGDGGVFGGDIVPTKTYWFVRFESGWSIVEAVAQNPTTKEYLYQRNGRWSKPLAFLHYMKVSPGSDEASLELRVKQAGFLGLSMLGWLVSWTLVYLAGVAVEVIIGFMKKRHNQTKRVDPVFLRRPELGSR